MSDGTDGMDEVQDRPQERSHGSNNLSLGTNQSGGRIYNERLVLSIVRHQSGLAKAEIARQTALSAQTISVIMKQLEADELIVKGAPQRGKVGQPSIPFSLNPDGAFSIGLKVGRHRSELMLMDFVGNIREHCATSYPYPITQDLLSFITSNVTRLIETLPPQLRHRVAGIGIATPFELWSWGQEVGAPDSVLEDWKQFDIKQEVSTASGLVAYLQNDTTAACAAELTFGNLAKHDNFLYIYIGYFIGGGVVLNGAVFDGPSGNAGALNSMPIRVRDPETGISSYQLVRDTSKIKLHRMLQKAGIDTSVIWDSDQDWSGLGEPLQRWIEQLCQDLAYAIVSATSVIDFPAIVIDGDIPGEVRNTITGKVQAELENMDRQGLSPVTVVAGTLGSNARILGGASLPILANFTRDRDVAFVGQ